jgi:hypothetical protein
MFFFSYHLVKYHFLSRVIVGIVKYLIASFVIDKCEASFSVRIFHLYKSIPPKTGVGAGTVVGPRPTVWSGRNPICWVSLRSN